MGNRKVVVTSVVTASERTDLCAYCKAVLGSAHRYYGPCGHKKLSNFSKKHASTKFYRVYDDTSVSAHQYRMRGDHYMPVSTGFEAGSRGHPPTVSAKTILKRHLDWRNRTPTPFISLYQSPERALKEARRRHNHPWVFFRREGWSRARGDIRVAVFECYSDFVDSEVKLFPTRGLVKSGVLSWHEAKFVDRSEWLAVSYIPGVCVSDDLSWEEFERRYG